MKNIKFYSGYFNFLFIAILGLATSCKKLDEKPISFVPPSDFYTTPAQIEAAFAASMNRLWDYWGGYGYGQGYFVYDDQYYSGDLVIPNNFASDLWDAHYAAILNLNSAIGAIKNGNLGNTVSQEDIDVLMGQAKFLRAHNYFMLVRMFGDLPLITEDTPDPVRTPMARSPISDVYALIVSDFTEAAAKLPTSWPSEQQGRPTSDAAKGLLTKVYITMATAPLNDVTNYQKAADLANEVIQAGNYSLVHDINQVFSSATKYGPEMMWSYNSNYADINTDPEIYRPGILDGWGDIGVQPEWAEKYPETPRKHAYLLTDTMGKHYTEWDEGRPYIKKFMYDNEDDYNNYSSVMNMPIIRYADVLLIFAEADNMAHGAPTQAAVDAVNQVIDRANGYVDNPLHPRLTTSMSKEAFDAAVIEERNQELCFEFDRWFDLIRKRILKEKSIPSIQQNFTEDDYLYPIPDKDIQLNPSLTQNPGYN